MWFKEILLITFQFCRLGECNWNDKAGERLRDFHVIVRMVFFHRFLIKTALSGLFGGSFCLSQLLHPGLRRSSRQGGTFPPKVWGGRRLPWRGLASWPGSRTSPAWQRVGFHWRRAVSLSKEGK